MTKKDIHFFKIFDKYKSLNILLFIFLTIYLTSCASFGDLPINNKNTKDFLGVYQNDPELSPFWSKKLWSVIHPKFAVEKDSLLVKFELSEDNLIKASLIDNDSVISSKIIKGKFKEDNCYYKRRTFYIIPILPILWMYENEQYRIYNKPEAIVLEETYNRGGVVIIMAGGNSGKYAYEYRKVD